MINASVELDPETLDPTYHLTLGLPGRSYAVTIAARLGVPSEIIDRARESLSPQDRAAEDLLRELQEERMTAENLRKEAEAALLEARQQRAQVAEQLSTVEASKVEILEEARRELLGRINGMLVQVPADGKGLGQPGGTSSRTETEERAYSGRSAAQGRFTPVGADRGAAAPMAREYSSRATGCSSGASGGPWRSSLLPTRRDGWRCCWAPCGLRCRCMNWNARRRDIRPRHSTACTSNGPGLATPPRT